MSTLSHNMRPMIEGSPPPGNRWSRRHGGSGKSEHGVPEKLRDLTRALLFYDQVAEEYLGVLSEDENAPLSEIIYRKEPVLCRYVDWARSLSIATQRADEFKGNPWVARRIRNDIYTRKIRGLTLLDIETMPLPLSIDDIKRIHGFLRRYLVSNLTLGRIGRVAQSIALALPSLDLARPHEVSIPLQLRPLHARMTDYFDYFIGFITEPYLDSEQSDQFSRVIVSAGPCLWKGLGCFLPARLGITPPSALKLFDEKIGFGTRSIFWRALKSHISKELSNAYRKDGLPLELQKYQRYNPDADKQAMGVLDPYYRRVYGLGSRLNETPSEDGNLHARLQRYKKSLRANILRSNEKFLRVQIDHPVIGEVIVASQYKKSLMFIAPLSDGKSHLALEINGDGRVYGISGALLREYPHIEQLLARDVLEPVLKYARQKYPSIEPQPVTRAKVPPVLVKSNYLPETFLKAGEDIPDKPPKRKRLAWAVRGLLTEAELPQPVRRRERVYRVEYSRNLVVEMAGEKLPNELIDRMMGALYGFEWGEKRAVALADMTDYCRLRIGDWRIILEHLGGGIFALRDIGHRSSVYSTIKS